MHRKSLEKWTPMLDEYFFVNEHDENSVSIEHYFLPDPQK
jgi:hypothetical protein